MQMTNDKQRLMLVNTFLILIILVWLDELIDMPGMVYGVEETPFNWIEAVLETILIGIVGIFTISRFARREESSPSRITVKGEGSIWIKVLFAFLGLCTFIWLNEIIDIPYLLFKGEKTPINWSEAAVETILIILVGSFALSIIVRNINERGRAQDLFFKSFHFNPIAATITSIKDGKIIQANEAFSRTTGYGPDRIIGKAVSDFNIWAHQDERDEVIGELYEKGAVRNREVEIRDIHGDIKTALYSADIIDYLGEKHILATAIDITDMKKAEEELHKRQKELLRSEEKFSKAFHASPDLMSISTLKEGIYIDVNDVFLKSVGYSLDEVIGRSAIELGIWGDKVDRDLMAEKVLEQGEIRNYEVIFHTRQGRELTMLLSADRFEIEGEDCLLMISRDITDRKYMEERIRHSEKQLRELYKNLQDAREAERTRISREIHDDLGQELTVLKLELQHLARRLPESEGELVEKASAITRHVDLAIDSVRRISMDLRPALLDQLGLIAAIEWQAEDFQNRTGIPCRLAIDPEIRIENVKLSTALFRVFQETLTNITRYAQASKVTVELGRRDGSLELIVKDNGKGISKEEIANPKSFGIIGMTERVSDWGGSIKISGRKGKGTTVMVNIPLSF